MKRNPTTVINPGDRFDRLTVVADCGERKNGYIVWECRCDCGREAVIGQTNLQSGKTRSCGCLGPETLREKLGMVEGTSVLFLKSNLSHLRVNNTSGHTGVYLEKDTGRWSAGICFKGKSYFLGRYDNYEYAVKAREKGEELHIDFLEEYYNGHLPEKDA